MTSNTVNRSVEHVGGWARRRAGHTTRHALRIHSGNVAVVGSALVAARQACRTRTSSSVLATPCVRGGRPPRALVVAAMSAFTADEGVQLRAIETCANFASADDVSLVCVPRPVARARHANSGGAAGRASLRCRQAQTCVFQSQCWRWRALCLDRLWTAGTPDMARECAEHALQRPCWSAAQAHGRGNGRVASGLRVLLH